MTQRNLLIGIGALQGLCVWLLTDRWPDDWRWRAGAIALLTAISVSSLVFHFCWTGRDRARLLAIATGIALVYAAVAGWVGWEMPRPDETFSGDNARATSWILATSLTVYVLGPFLQIFQRTGRFQFPYDRLFEHSWNNFFIAAVGCIFAGSLWTVLVLWGQLFELVGVDFFSDVFSERPFVFTVTGAALGFGISLGRQNERIVFTLRSVVLSIFSSLLPLTAFVALIFLPTLPFQGLERLWDTGRASYILLSWVSVSLLLLNAVFQDGSGPRPYSAVVRRIVEVGVFCSCAFVAISLWGANQRIDQYGLTPQRFYGVLVGSILGLYALGYAAAIVRGGSTWMPGLRTINRSMALVVIAVGLLVHTPVLDPLRWSADSQVRRLLDGRVDIAEFDFGYPRFQLGRAGARGLARLERLEHPRADEIANRLALLRDVRYYHQWNELLRESTQQQEPALQPSDFTTLENWEWPPGLMRAVHGSLGGVKPSPCRDPGPCVAVPIELDGEPGDEIVVLVRDSEHTHFNAFRATEDGYERYAYLRYETIEQSMDAERLAEALVEGRFETHRSQRRDLEVEGIRFLLDF